METKIKPDKSEEEVRLKKLEELLAKGINPYPAAVERSHSINEVITGFDSLSAGESSVVLVGRVRSIRAHGGSAFAHLEDGTGKIQMYIKKDDIESQVFELFDKYVDVGDFINVSGSLFVTKKGEKTVKVKDLKLIGKALLPLPDKWHGLQDEEDRFRKRYLDILTNPEVKDLFVKKSDFWNSIREFMMNRGFLEVQTPALENTTGGADAQPFVTHHNAFDMDVYLRISAGELWQKELMVAGYEKVFELGRIFRNEGISSEHLQDYTQMEFYWAYADWNMGMSLVEEMYKFVAKKTFGTLKFKIRDFEVDLGKPWDKYDYLEEIKKRTGLDISQTSVEEIKDKLHELKINYDDFDNLPRGIDQLWKYCRRQLSGPGFLIYPPKSVSPLAKESKDRPGFVEQYQVIIGGSENGKGYSELNDPLDQEKRFDEQQALRDAGDEEAQMKDEDFITALKYGMPPTTGFGISERTFAFLANKPVREAQIFPLMKPKRQ